MSVRFKVNAIGQYWVSLELVLNSKKVDSFMFWLTFSVIIESSRIEIESYRFSPLQIVCSVVVVSV